MIDDYNVELEEINNNTIKIYQPKVDEISSNNELILLCLHDEFYHSFCDECDKYYSDKTNKFNSHFEQKLQRIWTH